MSPLDDELRSMFQSRADVLAPPADPLAGVERRARRMRRNRVAASVAGAALAVAAVAIAVPALVPDHDGAVQQPARSPSASSAPSPTPTAPPTASADALDPAHPWAYRGDASVLQNGNLDTLKRDWAAKHPGSTLTALFGQIYEPSAKPEIVFVSHGPDGDRWGMSTTTESGTGFVFDQALPADPTALMAAVYGDESPRLLVLAGPATGDISYSIDGANFHTLVGPAPGVAFGPLTGDTSKDVVRVLDGNGDLDHPVFQGPAPDSPDSSQAATGPNNLLGWSPRGTSPSSGLLSQAKEAFGQAVQAKFADVQVAVLYDGQDASGRELLFLQAWTGTNPAHTFGYAGDGKSPGEPFFGPVTKADAPVLAYLVSAGPGQTADTLVLLPRPGAGPFSYATSSTAPYRPVGNARSDTGNVGVIARDPRATSDRIEVLDGDGMKVLYRGAVQPLLCGATSCG